MIHWLWLVPAFMAGGFLGVGVMCAMAIAKEGDEVMKTAKWERIAMGLWLLLEDIDLSGDASEAKKRQEIIATRDIMP